ncbi:MAG: hypothetical protein NC123_14110 [Butyrivibrio sp.]|nr:hypothetical protein [Butyrivibrio sp.]
MTSFSGGKARKLNYIIHNSNTAEETAKVLLEVLVQANAGKVERVLKELSECHEEELINGEGIVSEDIKIVGI